MTALRSYLLDPLERAASTFVQTLTVLLLATGSAGLVGYQAWGKAADVAAFAAIVSVVTSVLTFPVPKLPQAIDLLLRVVKTGVQAFAGVLASDQFTHSVVQADWHSALATTVPVMLAALLKGLSALALPWTDGASLLPVPAYTPVALPPVTVAPDTTSLLVTAAEPVPDALAAADAIHPTA